uniref:Uncharacterized protein n=1 Tax=Lactuca sativa TaxID=4236 RepID=A0A9R1UR04_LACSA|nr:hypothetical protein LSAT_V11C800448900 [Lactuca sativa]
MEVVQDLSRRFRWNTHIVLSVIKYKTRTNDILTNALGVCLQDVKFMYVLLGWKGLTTDGRVLRDALLRPHGLKVPRVSMHNNRYCRYVLVINNTNYTTYISYYLVDASYTNG